MSNTAAPQTGQYHGDSADRTGMNVQSFGFPPTEPPLPGDITPNDTTPNNTAPADSPQQAAMDLSEGTRLPVLARVPRLVANSPRLGANRPTLDSFASSNTRQYRIDSALGQPAQDQLSANQQTANQQTVDQTVDQLRIHTPHTHGPLGFAVGPPSDLSDAANPNDAPPQPATATTRFSAPSPMRSPIREARHLELSASGNHISTFLLRLQVMLKPLAQIILLTALLTASALAYLLLEDNRGPSVPAPQEFARPADLSAPRLTKKPLSIGPRGTLEAVTETAPETVTETASITAATAQPVLAPGRPLSAVGPVAHGLGGNRMLSTMRIAASKDVATSKKTTPSDTKLQPSVQPIAISKPTDSTTTATINLDSNTQQPENTTTEPQFVPPLIMPPSYPNTGHRNVTILPIASKTTSSVEQNDRPNAVAELTGSIQSPLKR